MVDIGKIGRILYYDIIPIIMGAVVFTYMGNVKDEYGLIRKLIIFAIIMIPVFIIYNWLGDRFLFPDKTALAYKILNKMANCEIRKERGELYCVDCPEGYECAKNVDLNKI